MYHCAISPSIRCSDIFITTSGIELAALLHTRHGPREMDYRHNEETVIEISAWVFFPISTQSEWKNAPVRVIRYTSQRIIPREESSQQSEEPSSLFNFGVRHALCRAVQIGDTEKEEGHVESEEKGEEGYG